MPRNQISPFFKRIKQNTGIDMTVEAQDEDYLQAMRWVLEQDLDMLTRVIKSGSPALLTNLATAQIRDIKNGTLFVLTEVLDRVIGKPKQVEFIEHNLGTGIDRLLNQIGDESLGDGLEVLEQLEKIGQVVDYKPTALIQDIETLDDE